VAATALISPQVQDELAPDLSIRDQFECIADLARRQYLADGDPNAAVGQRLRAVARAAPSTSSESRSLP
jgi:hypothetical protein